MERNWQFKLHRPVIFLFLITEITATVVIYIGTIFYRRYPLGETHYFLRQLVGDTKFAAKAPKNKQGPQVIMLCKVSKYELFDQKVKSAVFKADGVIYERNRFSTARAWPHDSNPSLEIRCLTTNRFLTFPDVFSLPLCVLG